MSPIMTFSRLRNVPPWMATTTARSAAAKQAEGKQRYLPRSRNTRFVDQRRFFERDVLVGSYIKGHLTRVVVVQLGARKEYESFR